MRTLARILLAAALLLGFCALIECFPGAYERSMQLEIQRFSTGESPNEILSHFQTELRQTRGSRIDVATSCSLLASFLLYLRWIMAPRLKARPAEPFRAESVILSAKPRLL